MDQVSLRDLYTALAFDPGERVVVNTKMLPDGRFESKRVVVQHLYGWSPPQDREVWFSTQSLRDPVGSGGRGKVSDVVNVRTLHADLDVKSGAFRSESECERVVARLEDLLGAGCAFRIYSGGGVQPLWRIADGAIAIDPDSGDPSLDELARWDGAFERWHALVVEVAAEVTRRSVQVDNTADLSRILRCPGSINTKHPDRYPDGRPVRTTRGTGESVTYAQLVSVLDGAGIDAEPRGSRLTRKSSDADATELLSALSGGSMSSAVRSACDGAIEALTPGAAMDGSRHEAMKRGQMKLLRLAERDEPGVRDALGDLRAAFITAVGPDRGDVNAGIEFDRALSGAAALVAGDPTPKLELDGLALAQSGLAPGGFWHPKTKGGICDQMGWGEPGDALEYERVPLRQRLMSFSDTRNSEPAVSLVGQLLYRDTLVQYSAEQGTYKSFFAMGLACAVASGESWGQHSVPERGRVVYVAAEGIHGAGVRARGWCAANGVDPGDLEGWLYFLPEPVQLGDSEPKPDRNGTCDVTEAVEIVRELDADLLVLDTRARCTVGLEENSATDQGRAIESAERIRRAAGCTVLVIHHAGKSGTQRGTTAWPGAAWTLLTSERSGPNRNSTGDPMGITVTVEKHKDAEVPAKMSFDLEPTTVPEDWMPKLNEKQRSTLVAMPCSRSHADIPITDGSGVTRGAVSGAVVGPVPEMGRGDTRSRAQRDAQNARDVLRLRDLAAAGYDVATRDTAMAAVKATTSEGEKGWGAQRATRAVQGYLRDREHKDSSGIPSNAERAPD